MIEPKRIFVDTSAWIEHILKKEFYHKKVFDYLTREARAGSKFFTSDYVLDETYTRLLTNQGIKDARNFRKYIRKAERQGNLLVLFTEEVLFNKAWQFFEKFSEHKLSFTNATIYTFVKDLKIDEVLTLDKGFKKSRSNCQTHNPLNMSKQKRSNKNAGLQSYSKVNEIAGSLAHLAKKHNLGRKKEREMVQKLVAREIAREGL